LLVRLVTAQQRLLLPLTPPLRVPVAMATVSDVIARHVARLLLVVVMTGR